MSILDLVIRPYADLFARFNNAPQYVPKGYNNAPSMLGNAPGRPNVEAQIRTMGSVSTVFAIVNGIGDSMAEADWTLYPIGSDVPVKNHPAGILWENPNPFMDQDTFVKAAMEHYDLAGETDWYVSRTALESPTTRRRISEQPMELWPVRPDFLTPIPHPTKYLEGWIYEVPGTMPVRWQNNDLIRMLLPSPFDPYRGIAPIASAMRTVGNVNAAAAYTEAWFRNGAAPGGIIEFPERLPDDAFDEFTERWRRQHQGPMNANRVAVLEGAKWTSITQTMRESQFEELSKLDREWIREAYRYPRALLGYSDDVNKASARAMIEIFVTLCIRPRLNALQAVLNTRFLPMFGASATNLEFRFTNPVVADKEMELLELTTKAEAAATLTGAGFDPDDVLKTVGLPPMAFSKPEPPAMAAPDDEDGNGAPPARRGRPSRQNDPDARAIWEDAETYMREHRTVPFSAVANLVGVSERTLRRYKGQFEGD